MFHKTTLKNGLKIIAVPMKNTQAVTVLMLIGTGSRYETKEIQGISHFLEHMFFKGTKKRPNALKLNEPIDQIGGIHNAFTSREYTGYWAKVNNQHLDLVLDWVSDIYLNSKLEEKEIQKEKGVIMEEINRYLDIPESYIWRLWENLLYGDHPAGWNIDGTKESIKTIDRKKLLDYLKNHYSSQNTIICLAGNINVKTSIRKIKRYFQSIKTTQVKSKLQVIEKQNYPQSLIHYKKTDQTHLCLGVRGYNIFHSQRYVQEILAVILGGMMTSRLYLKIREKLGLVYYIETDSITYSDVGYLVTSTGVNNEQTEIVIKTILKEFKEISQKRVSKTELQKAKDNIKGKMALGLESSNAQANFYGMQELLEDKILNPQQICAKIDQITIKDIQKVAQDIFQPKNLNLALIGPYKDDKIFKETLDSF